MDSNKVKETVRRMTEARAVLVRDNPFFGRLAMGLKLACAPCETACTDGNRLIFDPAFAERLSDAQMLFVTLHEVLHCVLAHCTRGKNLDSFLYNIACDIVVNSIILDMWGVDTFTIDGVEAMHLAPDGYEGLFYNAEEVYHMLLQKNSISHHKKQKHNMGDSNGAGDLGDHRGSHQSEGLNSPEKSDTGSGGKGDKHPKEPVNGGRHPGASFDRHDLWQGIADKTLLRDQWNDKVHSAYKNCGNTTGIPQSIRKVIKELEDRRKVNWKQLLHDFLQFDQYDYTFLPPDRRYASSDFYLPAFNIDEDNGSACDIWVCVDTSGSISEKELCNALVEILDAMRQVRLKGKISFFDSNITEPEAFETEEEFKHITPSGGGGTSFHIIFDYLKEKMYPDLPKAILIFTDGYANWPDESDAMDVPVLWIFTHLGKDKAPWGRVVKL